MNSRSSRDADLRRFDASVLQRQVNLAAYTTWKIGGPAEYFLEPESIEQLQGALQWARERGVTVHRLGRGSNVLVDDNGLPGLTVCFRNVLDEVVHDASNDQLYAGAGISLMRLSKEAAALGWLDYTFLIGIPGTVGGAVFMNAGYKKGDTRDMAHLVQDVRLLSPAGELQDIPYADLQPVYRHTALQNAEWRDWTVVGAYFRPQRRGSPDEIRAATAEHLAMRKATQPLTQPTAGSVFCGTEEGVPAAVYIDQAGLKGFTIGGARISPKHANWIENHTRTATAADVRALMAHVIDVVEREFGVRLRVEIQNLPG